MIPQLRPTRSLLWIEEGPSIMRCVLAYPEQYSREVRSAGQRRRMLKGGARPGRKKEVDWL